MLPIACVLYNNNTKLCGRAERRRKQATREWEFVRIHRAFEIKIASDSTLFFRSLLTQNVYGEGIFRRRDDSQLRLIPSEQRENSEAICSVKFTVNQLISSWRNLDWDDSSVRESESHSRLMPWNDSRRQLLIRPSRKSQRTNHLSPINTFIPLHRGSFKIPKNLKLFPYDVSLWCSSSS